MFDESAVFYLFSPDNFRVRDGVARGDALSGTDALVMDDIYQLSPEAVPVGSLGVDTGRQFFPENRLTFMTQHGRLVDMLTLLDECGVLRFLPLSALDDKDHYRLIAVQTQGLNTTFADLISIGPKRRHSV